MKFKALSSYRSDIDGLRALAVLSVLIFHAFPDWLPGGFAGVDVFFVISGFLITGIIWRENDLNKFSFLNFYARRIRRIFPSLILVLLSCTAFGWWVLFDDEFKQLGNHAMRAALFLSNFTLWREAGYFDAQAELKPLLHLWSLAIEEQFYIFWPAAIWAIKRKSKYPLAWLIGLLFASFFWNIYKSFSDPVHDFYSPLTRFWELMAGAVLAVAPLSAKSNKFFLKRNILGGAGILLLVTSMFLMGNAKVYPSGWAIWPVLGAVFFIFSEGQLVWLQKWMTSRAVLWIGEISYVLYLWHWPILSFLRIIEGHTPNVILRIAGLLLSFALSVLTVYFWENHFRYDSISRVKICFLVFLMTLVFGLGYMINKAKGFPGRSLMENQYEVYPGSIGHDEFLNHFHEKFQPYKFKNIGDFKSMNVPCFQSNMNIAPDIMLLGDSHAEHLLIGLSGVFPNKNVAFCGFGGLPVSRSTLFPIIAQGLKETPSIRTLIITAQWHTRLKELPKNVDPVLELKKTIEILKDSEKKIYLVDDIYQFDFDPQRCKYERPLSGGSTCTENRRLAEEQFSKYMPVLKEVYQQVEGIKILKIRDVLCTESDCSMLAMGSMAYRDNNHLSRIGSHYIARKLVDQF